MTLRDLTVGIDFGDVDISRLLAVDDAIDEIENSLQSLGNDIIQTGVDMQAMSSMAGGALDNLAANANQAEQALDDLESIDVEIDGIMEAIAGLETLEATGNDALATVGDEADDASAQVAQLGATAVATGASSGVMAALFNTSMSSMGMSMLMFGGKVTIVAALVVAAFGAIIAAGAPLLMFTMGLVSSLAAAGLAVGALAAVAIPTFGKMAKGMEEIDKLQEKIANADTAKERLAAEKELAAVWEGMSDSQHDATHALMEFKEFFSEFAASFEAPIFDIFTMGLEVVKGLLTGLEPVISGTLDVIHELTESLNNTIVGGGFTQFFDWLAVNGAESLRSFATIGGNLIAGFFSILQTFAPIGASIEESLISLTERFQLWAAGLGESNGFTSFIEYAKTNTPILIDFLKQTWDAITALVEAFAPMGSTVLEALGAIMGKLAEFAPKLGEIADGAMNFATTIVENWTPITDTILALGATVGSFVLIMKGLQVIGLINTLFMAWRAGTLLQTAAMLGLNLAMLANPITWIVAGIALLIGAGVMLYRNWDTVKVKIGELWAAMQEKWSAIQAKTSSTWESVKTAVSNAMTVAKTAVSNFFSPLMGFIDSAKAKWDGFKSAISNFKMPNFQIPGAGLLAKAGAWINGSHANGLARVPFDGYTAELHKDEAVLTADQANQMRRNGQLGASGDRPSVDIAKTSSGGGNGGGGVNFAPVININANGNADAQSIKEQVSAAMEEQMAMFWRKMDLQLEG